MAEVFHFDECLVKEVTGTVETRIDNYATGVSVSLARNFFDIKDDTGQIIKRFEAGKEADMSIDALFAADIDFTDGNNIKLYYGNVIGTTTYQMGSCYIKDKGWSQSEDDAVKHDVKIVGRTFGTV